MKKLRKKEGKLKELAGKGEKVNNILSVAERNIVEDLRVISKRTLKR